MALYNVGDIVVVRSDLTPGVHYGMIPKCGRDWVVVDSMCEIAGRVAIIEEVARNGNYYCIDLMGGYWTDEMFERIDACEDIELSQDEIMTLFDGM